MARTSSVLETHENRLIYDGQGSLPSNTTHNERYGKVTAKTTVTRSDIQKSKSNGGFRPPLPYSYTESKQDPLMWFIRAKETSYADVQQGHVSPWRQAELSGAFHVISALTPIAPSGNAAKRMSTQMLNDLKGQRVNLSMALASRKQTANLLASSARTLHRSVTAALKGNFKQAAGAAGLRYRPHKSIADKYLALVFGYRPLMNDIYGLYQELCSEKSNRMMVVVRGKASERVQRDASRIVLNTDSGSWNFGKGVALLEQHDDITQKMSWWFELDAGSLQDLARNGLTNPAVVAWDSVPFSFVLDWLVPVGRVLNALDAQVGFKYLGGSHTTFIRSITTVKDVTFEPRSEDTYLKRRYAGSASAHCAASRVEFTRKVVPNPGASLYVQNPFSSFTITSTAALILQRNSRK